MIVVAVAAVVMVVKESRRICLLFPSVADHCSVSGGERMREERRGESSEDKTTQVSVSPGDGSGANVR
jgi:hypothetical protein